MTQDKIMSGPKLKKLLLCGAAALSIMTSFTLSANAEEGLPFAITVDGEAVDGSITDPALQADTKLNAADIQVKFDGLGVHPTLNVSTFPVRVSFKPAENIRFLASLNYSAWITRGEIRISPRGPNAADRPIAVIPISKLGAAEWQLPLDAPDKMQYVLRVYDADGRYDETRPLPLDKSNSTLPLSTAASKAVAPGYGEDRTAIRNISVFGGAVTVYGKNIPEGHEVTVDGEPVPVDGSNGFVVQRIFPSGHQTIDISVKQDGQGLDFTRDIEVPDSEWFYVGLADLTAGHDFNKNAVQSTSSDEFDGVWTRGRAAFYLKGKIKGQYILTASADTGEGSLKDMIKGFDGKDPQSALKRIDPNAYYPVYGDDSTTLNDAPTNGKFYVRLEKGPSSLMWGNFHTNISGTHFMKSARALYGANGVYKSQAVTKDGEAKVELDAYAAQPSTVPGHEVFRGTGGSAYFLKHRDLTPGTESLILESRNPVTGWVVESRTLTYRTDYEINYVLGVITLRDPINATNANGSENYLVALYEYTPIITDKNGYITGARAQGWLGDNVRLGVSGMTEKTQGADQKVVGADVRVQSSKDTFIEAEVARSEGPGFSTNYSADGGLTLQNNASAGIVGKKAWAGRVAGQADLTELTDGAVQGRVGAAYERYNKGYSSLDVQAPKTKEVFGADADFIVSDTTTVKADYSEQHVLNESRTRQANAKINTAIGDGWSIEPSGRYTEKTGSTATTPENGTRADAGAKLIYTWDTDKQAYVFAQATVARSGTMLKDNRAGIGGKTKITDRIGASGEISGGTQGIDATAAVSYDVNATDRFYVGYRLDATRDTSSSFPYHLNGEDLGTIIIGARKSFGEQWSTHGEDSFDIFGVRNAITQTYGITYTPTHEWSFDGSAEIGRVYDNSIDPSTGLKNKNINRQAASLSGTYHAENGIDAKLKGEARWDGADDGSSEIMSYLLQYGFGAKMSKDWRALGKLDVVLNDATDSTRDGMLADGMVGFAYRPAASDRFNMLFKYNYVYDNPGGDQVGVDGTTSSPAQESNILSADASYDLTHSLTVGAKYGFRIGKTRERIVGAQWENSSAHLGIIRADLHIVKQWDALLEGRLLWSPESQTQDLGVLVAIYRELGDNFKVGIGYNFGTFSDDLRDLKHDDKGVFLNVVGKF
jgi:hypothetical protein